MCTQQDLSRTHTHTQGKPDIAVPLCKKAIIELEQKKGRDNPDLASMLNILAVIHRYTCASEYGNL